MAAIDDVSALCTGLTASWCPRCGDCSCERLHYGECVFDDAACPLHGTISKHADTITREECRQRVDMLAEDCDVEISNTDRETLAQFAHYLFEKSRKQKEPVQ